ncbi:MAG: PilZ domain-containing protein [Burkholderiales bacterium]|nr:PilZ domain-containing protein [Burkholderiales bacterium]
MKLNTRVHGRIHYNSWVKVIPKTGSGVLGNIEDISISGIGVENDKPVSTGDDCHVYFMLPFNNTEHIVQARCRIASCHLSPESGRYHVGLAFLEFISDPRGTVELIESFVRYIEQAGQAGQ